MSADLMRELEAARARIAEVEAERDDLRRKGKDLCCAYGSALVRLKELGETRFEFVECPHKASLAALRALPENEEAIAAAAAAVKDVLLHPTGVPSEEIRAALRAALAAVEVKAKGGGK